jgi:chorismate synthase
VTGVVIRPLSGLAEREACVALQERVWGQAFADRVPASVLLIALETGGVASGAFVAGRLAAFVFGITGYRDGRPVHWSDMLAVAPEHRGLGLGYRLKLHQRERLLAAGVDTVLWTFDPLVARNAHLNLRRLGAIAREYRRDVYGASESPLHAGIGTDRLLAEWAIGSSRVADRIAADDAVDPVPGMGVGDAPVLNPPVRAGGVLRPSETVRTPEAGTVRIAIPADIQALKQRDLSLAVAWRKNVRTALEGAFRDGYTAVDLDRGEVVARYVLVRGFDR